MAEMEQSPQPEQKDAGLVFRALRAIVYSSLLMLFFAPDDPNLISTPKSTDISDPTHSREDYVDPYGGGDSDFAGARATVSKDCVAARTVPGWLDGLDILTVKKGTTGVVMNTEKVGNLLVNKLAYPEDANGGVGVWMSSACLITLIDPPYSYEEYVNPYEEYANPYGGGDYDFAGAQATVSKDCVAARTVPGWLDGLDILTVKKGTTGVVMDTVMMSLDGSRIVRDPNEVGYFLVKLAYPGDANGGVGVWMSSACFNK